MRRILLAIGSSDIGGAQVVFLNHLRELVRLGYVVTVLLPEGPLVRLIDSGKVEMKITNFRSLSALLAVARILHRGKFDLVNAYLTRCSLVVGLANVAARTPSCCTLLNAIIHEKLNWMQRLGYPWMYRLIQRLTDGIIVNAEHIRQNFASIAGMNAQGIRLIYPGVETASLTDGQEGKKRGPVFVIGSVGRLSVEKGNIYLLKALNHLKGFDFECLIAGDGPSRSQLEAYVRDNGLRDRVRFLGFRANVAEIMQQLDVLVLPSLNEALGLSIVEACRLKTVVIASDVGGIPEVIQDAVSGLLVPAKDEQKLAEKIAYIHQHPEEARKMAEAGHRYASGRFTTGIMTGETLKYYSEILARRNSPAG
jgi:glycosyltransferase involved in cell wall biosynthesis